MKTSAVRVLLLVFAVLVVLSACAAPAPVAVYAENPADAVLVGDDVSRFWAAVDDGRRRGDVRDALERGYLSEASPQLQSFAAQRIGSAAALATAIESHQRYYDAIRDQSLRLARGEGYWPEVQRAFVAIERIEPSAVFPPVAIVVGRLNSGGTTSPAGILIGSEMIAPSDLGALGSLSAAQRSLLLPPESLAFVIVHEEVHVLQEALGSLRSGDDRSLLERAIVEGSADWIAEAVTGRAPSNDAYRYGREHEAELWNEFRLRMDGRDVRGWLYSADDRNRPRDLGYFIGYRIAARFAHALGDRDVAIRALLRATSAAAVLAASGYNGVSS